MATVRKEQRSAIDFPHAGTLPVVLIVAALVVGFTALLPLVQSSGATSTAGDIEQLQRERQDWQARLHELEVDVATLGSLARIEKEARTRLGMTRPKETHYITVDAPPPEERKLPSRFLSPDNERAETDKSVWDTLFGWLP